jgi:hypothetical protein
MIAMNKRVLYEYIPAWLLLTVFLLIVLHAPLTVFVGSHWPAIALPVKAWKEVLIGAAALLVGIRMFQTRQWNVLSYDYLGWIILCYWGLHVASLGWTSASPQAAFAGLLIDLRYMLYSATVYHFLRMYPSYLPSFIKVGAVGAVIVVGFATLQLALPADALKYLGYSDSTIQPYLTVDKNPDYVRFNSTLRGPNPLGAYAIIVLAAVVSFIATKHGVLTTKRRRLGAGALFIMSMIALWTSYSRSAALGAIAAVAIVLGVRYGRRMSKRVWTGVAAATIVLGLVGYAMKDTNFVANVILHNDPVTGASVDSNAGHISSLNEGVTRAIAEPLGRGVGTTGSASLYGDSPNIIENQYLMIAHEVGWLGVVLFLGVYLTFLRRMWPERSDWLALSTFASGVGLGLVGLVLPVWADDTVSIIWWGLAAVALAWGDRHGKSSIEETA